MPVLAGHVVFFQTEIAIFFILREMTAVGLGRQGFQTVGSGFESVPCQKCLRFIPKIFQFPKLVKH